MDKLFSSASSLFGSSSTDEESAPPSSHQHAPPSSGDLYSSAQILMNAAKSKISPGQSASGEDLDMGSLAGAASNILGAAVQYGKLDGTSYGQYAHKAEAYLHDYQSKHGRSDGATHPASQGEEYQPSEQAHRRPIAAQQSEEEYPTSEQGHRRPTAQQESSYGQSNDGYSETEQGYGTAAASHEYRQDYSESHQRHRPAADSQEYSQDYSPDEYPESEEGRRRPTRYS